MPERAGAGVGVAVRCDKEVCECTCVCDDDDFRVGRVLVAMRSPALICPVDKVETVEVRGGGIL